MIDLARVLSPEKEETTPGARIRAALAQEGLSVNVPIFQVDGLVPAAVAHPPLTDEYTEGFTEGYREGAMDMLIGLLNGPSEGIGQRAVVLVNFLGRATGSQP